MCYVDNGSDIFKVIKNIIFDLGGVLVDWSPRYVYKHYFDTEEAMEYFFANVCTFDWNEQQDGGRTIAEANRVLIDQFPEYQREILAFYGRWEEMLGGPITGTVDILNQIKDEARMGLYALTNWSAETWPVAVREYDFLNTFEGILVSGQEKIKKPAPAIYELILSRYGLIAEECLFIDDNQRNVEAAIGCGIRSIKFQNPEQLQIALSKEGIFAQSKK